MSGAQERRHFGRREVNVLGWIRIDGRPRLPCSIQNITRTGAFLELQPPGWLPFKFMLELAHDGQLVGCEVRHAGATGIGVSFIPAAEVHALGAGSHGPDSEAVDWQGVKGAAARRGTKPAAHADPAVRSLVSRVRASIAAKGDSGEGS